jgi:lipopolysaccharide export system protein LptC
VAAGPNRGTGHGDDGVTTAYPVDSARDRTFGVSARGDIARVYRSAVRHSRHVRVMRGLVLAGIAAVLFAVVAANYMPEVGVRLPGEIGKLVIKGTKITMQQPKLTGYTSDARAYEFTAQTAAQDITKPDIIELEQLHAKMEMKDDSSVEMTAPSGVYNIKTDVMTLNDDIAVASSTGYAARLTEAVVDMHSGDVVSDQPVKVKLLNGFLDAKKMTIAENGAVLNFGGHVTLVLHPDKNDKPAPGAPNADPNPQKANTQ